MSSKIKEIPQKDVKAICREYKLSQDSDMLNLSDDEVVMKEALNSLSPSDYVLFCLYCELASERKLAKMLGISRSPISKEIKRIREQIKQYIYEHSVDIDSDSDNGGIRT